jgi:hypothetical protein
MWHRTAALLLLLAAALSASAQVNNVYSRAIPPDKAALERLNLKIEWTAYIPVEGRRDSLTQIQTIDDQIFVQTRTGLFIAGDALTGRLQWVVQLGNGGYSNSYPVAANSEYVFVAHVTNLHAFHRYTGVVEFVTDLGSPPTTGLAADETGVYCVLGLRSGSSSAHRLTVYDLPRPIAIPDVPKGRPDPDQPPRKDPRAVNPVDNLLTRYAPEHMYRSNPSDRFDTPRRRIDQEIPVGGLTGGRSPSLAALPRITPPYTLTNEVYAPSVAVLPVVAPALSPAKRLPEGHPAHTLARDNPALRCGGHALERSAAAEHRTAGAVGIRHDVPYSLSRLPHADSRLGRDRREDRHRAQQGRQKG